MGAPNGPIPWVQLTSTLAVPLYCQDAVVRQDGSFCPQSAFVELAARSAAEVGAPGARKTCVATGGGSNGVSYSRRAARHAARWRFRRPRPSPRRRRRQPAAQTAVQAPADQAQPQAPPAKPAATEKKEPKPAEEQAPRYEEQVVVTASKVEQQLVNAPATVSVIGAADAGQQSRRQDYAGLFRAVPGVNVTQTSARDLNITSRGATGTLSTTQLALIDGRSVYLDFFGFVGWDFLPVNFTEIKQIEVIRGPGVGHLGRQRDDRRREHHHEVAARDAGHDRSRWASAPSTATVDGQTTDPGNGGIVLHEPDARPGHQRPLVLQGVGRRSTASDPFARPVGNIDNSLPDAVPDVREHGHASSRSSTAASTTTSPTACRS